MRFFAAIVSTVAIGSAAALDFCPSANGLIYNAGNRQYQVKCGIEYFTATNLQSSQTNDPVACAAACNAWTRANPKNACAAGSYDVSNGLCFLKPSPLNPADKRDNSGVITLPRI